MENKKYIKEQSVILKQPSTIKQQIETLKERNVIVENEEFAYRFLRIFNYYYITGYLHPYKISPDKYSNITFNAIVTQIKFDMRLREICMYCLDTIEKTLKSIIAYEFAQCYEYGNIAYISPISFPNNEHKHKKLMEYYDLALKNNKKLPFVKHNLNKYGSLPIWAAIELFTLGNLEMFFSMLNSETKKNIEKVIGFPQNKIQNWIKNLRIFRNMVAHNQRLYNFSISSTPLKAREYKNQSGRIFDYMVVMKYLFLDKYDWNYYVISRFDSIFKDFENTVNIKCIGFPENWKDILFKFDKQK